MATTAGNRVFVDANILIYARYTGSAFHRAAVDGTNALAGAGHELWVSRQTLREYMAATSRPGALTPPLTAADIAADVHAFEARFRLAEDGPAVTAELLSLFTTVPVGGKQVHDMNIVATMLAVGIPTLYTHNVADFTRFAAWITVIPLVPPPPPPGVP